MKKYLFIAAAAVAMLAACQVKEELAFNAKQDAIAENGIRFDVYTQRGVATRAGEPGDVTNDNIGNLGFGVFAYYTPTEVYDANAKPNFMYNQKVTKSGENWVYEPVKYWPNEYGSAAVSDAVDYVSFFAYAPWTEVSPTTGEVVGDKDHNIVSMTKNSATGDPIIKYVVDTDPATSVDLLFGVAAKNAASTYDAIGGNTVNIEAGRPFMNLVKPANPMNDKLSFNLKHSLAKVKFTIDYVADAVTPDPSVIGGASATIDSSTTRIFVRSFAIDGWALKGALNLNNSADNNGEAGEPLWKDFDGSKDLSFAQLVFNDGRKDNGREGTEGGIAANEENKGLNPEIIENYADLSKGTDGFNGVQKHTGVLDTPQLLFGGTGDPEADDEGYFYVIPRNSNEDVNVTITYDIETIDPALSGLLSDGQTHGISIENIISKEKILGDGKDFEAGKQYLIKIHIGMTSVKIDAIVTEWVPTEPKDVDLPDNQPMPEYWYDTVSGKIFAEDPTNGFVVTDAEIINDEESWANSVYGGILGKKQDPGYIASYDSAIACGLPVFGYDFGIDEVSVKFSIKYTGSVSGPSTDEIFILGDDSSYQTWGPGKKGCFFASFNEYYNNGTSGSGSPVYTPEDDGDYFRINRNPADVNYGKAANEISAADFEFKVYYNPENIIHVVDGKVAE